MSGSFLGRRTGEVLDEALVLGASLRVNLLCEAGFNLVLADHESSPFTIKPTRLSHF